MLIFGNCRSNCIWHPFDASRKRSELSFVLCLYFPESLLSAYRLFEQQQSEEARRSEPFRSSQSKESNHWLCSSLRWTKMLWSSIGRSVRSRTLQIQSGIVEPFLARKGFVVFRRFTIVLCLSLGMFNITVQLDSVVRLLVHHPDYVLFVCRFEERKKRSRRFSLRPTTFPFLFCLRMDSPTLWSISKSLTCAGRTRSRYAIRRSYQQCSWWNVTANSKLQSHIDYCQDHHIDYIIQHSGSVEVGTLLALNL